MTFNTLFTLRDWLTVDETRGHEANVLRLVIDGRLKSVNLDATVADCWDQT